MKQALLTNFSASSNKVTVETLPIQYNSNGNPRNKVGRASTYLTSQELKTVLQQYYFSNKQDEKQRIFQFFGKRKIRDALAICKLDLGKQGAIGRRTCSFHGSKYLVYNWLGSEDGVRLRCFPPGDAL